MSLRALLWPRKARYTLSVEPPGGDDATRAGWRVVFSSSGDSSRAGSQPSSSFGTKLASAARIAAGSLFSTMFPGDCRHCDAPLETVSRVPVCLTCLATARRIVGRTCIVCGERLVSPHTEAEPLCGLCRRVEMPFARAVAYGSYEGALRDLIHLLKYEGVRPAANILGRMLAEAAQELPAMEAPMIIPVPLHARRQRERMFNQAELIARAAAKVLQARHVPPTLSRQEPRDKGGAAGNWLIRADVMRRKRPTGSQTGLTRHQRRENIRGAFELRKPQRVKGRDVILVDDVFTTGTTATECARVLRRAGAARVFVATVARVLKAEAAPAPPADATASNQQEARAAGA